MKAEQRFQSAKDLAFCAGSEAATEGIAAAAAIEDADRGYKNIDNFWLDHAVGVKDDRLRSGQEGVCASPKMVAGTNHSRIAGGQNAALHNRTGLKRVQARIGIIP